MRPGSNSKHGFIDSQARAGADPLVTKFIADFLYAQGPGHADALRSVFRAGYCYYFAHMLELAFRRGQVCWAAPYGHFIWLDDDKNPYDAEGLYFGEAADFVPERYLGEAVGDFLHVDGAARGTSAQEIRDIVDRYRRDNGQDQ